MRATLAAVTKGNCNLILCCCSDRRVRDIQFLKKELEQKLDEILLETDALVAVQSRVLKALEACKELLRPIALCLEER